MIHYEDFSVSYLPKNWRAYIVIGLKECFFCDKPCHIALDSKCMRSAVRANHHLLNLMVRNVSSYDSELQLHMVSAYDVTNHISLGQECVPSKSN